MGISFPTGTLRIISPTESVKDRLAAWYHWKDRQSLNQARLVAHEHDIDIEEVRQWSLREGMELEFKAIKELLTTRKAEGPFRKQEKT